MEEKKIRFKDLSGWLKFGIIISWMLAAFWLIALVIGFMIGIMTPI